ncbi:metal ABC transporter ATP-binding protein [Candidatus Nomurabacteria bacterium]|nr:metal ABC transporter ATP-binding protein [Candidatus Kaiserbacteria bacterium]MCB9815324.1 metal ABC transporter ATP-binding protein [Candidatus Nomurabacteria bacterium]MCB9819547.1 metal ABC transporter ATP-binding protein [Candidatus Nomurabacteria bacterium]
MVNAIEINDVSVQYDGNFVLENTSMNIPYGILMGVIGMNGAGKSTLFKVIMGLVQPVTGRVEICGDPPSVSQKHGHVAYVPQNELVDWDFPVSVYEVVMMGRVGLQNIFKTPSKEDREYVENALTKVNMMDFVGRQIGELSGGQKKRVFVARALAQGADILLLDEPFAGLDAVSEKSLTKLLVDLKNEGKTVILATHELTSLPDICDQVALVRKTIVAYGPTKEVFTRELVSKTFDGIMHNLKFDN